MIVTLSTYGDNLMRTRKEILESRIARLEKLLIGRKSVKNESFESDLDEAGARSKADSMAKEFSRLTGMARFTPDNLGNDVIISPMYGWLSLKDTDEIAEDVDARFAFQYSNSKFTIIVFPTDGTVQLLNNDGMLIDPKNGRELTGYNDDIENPSVGAFPLSVWANARLRGIKSAKEITPEDRRLAEFMSKSSNFEPDEIAKLVRRGYDIDMQDKTLGQTALMNAVMQGNYKVVEYLLNAGADPNIRDKHGWTALTIANRFQKTHPHDIIGTLLEYGATE